MFFRSREELPGQPFAFIWSLCFGFFAFTLMYFFSRRPSQIPGRLFACSGTPPFPHPCMHFVDLKYNRTSRLMCGRGLLRWQEADHSDVLPYSS